MALNYQLLLGRSFQDLDPVVAGEAALEGGECVGPIRYSYTLIHFVRHGRGVLKLQSGEYPVCAGQAFLILPGDLASYTADEADPWTYQWIGFSGSLAHDFAMLPRYADQVVLIDHAVLCQGTPSSVLDSDAFRKVFHRKGGI